MRNIVTLAGAAAIALLVTASGASAQTIIQPQYQAGSGSGQSFLYQPAPTGQASAGARSLGASSGGSTQGPVTGYGAGGLTHAPGTASNPPYFRGGTGGMVR
jgi:hypothetical protein